MAGTSQTLVINNVDHPYIFPAVLIVLFGTIFLYNTFMLVYHNIRMKKLSLAEGMIRDGHAKLVKNQEDILLEGGGVLDKDFMKREIAAAESGLKSLNPAEEKKRIKKAEIRQKKREEAEEKARLREEKKRLAKEAKAAKKLTPEQYRKKMKEEADIYDRAYEALTESAELRILSAEKILSSFEPKELKRMAMLEAKYGNKTKAKKAKADQKKADSVEKKKNTKKERALIKKTREEADVDLFGKDEDI